MKQRLLALTITACFAALSGCSDRQPPAPSAVPAAPSAMPQLEGKGRGDRLEGRIVEKLAAGSYTYLAIAPEQGEQRWAVVMGKNVPAPGASIALVAMGLRKDFYSPRLGRHFDELMFATVASAGSPVQAAQ